MGKQKILILGNSHLVVFGFRGELIERLIREGYEVIVSFPNGPFGEGKNTSEEYGCRFIETDIERRKTNPLSDLKLINDYLRLIKKEQPDAVLAYTVKCDTYGGIACRITHTPFLPNITGIGKGLAEGGLVERILVWLYRIALKKAAVVFFQNESDNAFFERKRIRFSKCQLLPGSGVNLKKYPALEYPSAGPVVFTYIARVMKTKGIEQFLDAARFVKTKYKNTEFHICGYCEEDYRSVMESEEKTGNIVYHGLVNNIIDYERISHCIVLPTFHPEGISNVLLEAAACARPIITTDRAGCREAVDDGVTGFLVKERDSRDLIDKIEQFLSLPPEARRDMGQRGRVKMEKEFDRQIVVDAYMNEIHSLL